MRSAPTLDHSGLTNSNPANRTAEQQKPHYCVSVPKCSTRGWCQTKLPEGCQGLRVMLRKYAWLPFLSEHVTKQAAYSCSLFIPPPPPPPPHILSLPITPQQNS